MQEVVPRTLGEAYQEELDNGAQPRFGKTRNVAAYFNNLCFTKAGLYGDPEWDVMMGCGPVTIPHPDDEDGFAEHWSRQRSRCRRNCFIEKPLPEAWLHDSDKWERDAERFENFYA